MKANPYCSTTWKLYMGGKIIEAGRDAKLTAKEIISIRVKRRLQKKARKAMQEYWREK